MKKAWKKNINLSAETAKRRVRSKKSFEREHFLHSKMKPHFSSGRIVSFLDIGCGEASFLRFLSQRYPSVKFTGIEYDAELVRQVRAAHPGFSNIHLKAGDARTFRVPEKFDAVMMSGVLSIFDDAEAPVANLLRHLKPGGRGFIFGGFCSAPVDVLVRFRVLNGKSDEWQSGLNMVSLQTLKEMLSKQCASVRFHRFELRKNLQRQRDPMRTYTLRTPGRKIIVNGANIVREFFLVEFKKKK